MTHTDEGPALRRAARWPWIWAALTWVLAVAVAGLTVALIATHNAASVANCVNHDLGTRQGPSSQDAEAHIAYAQAQAKVQTAQLATSRALLAVLQAPKPEQPAKFVMFVAAFRVSQEAAAMGQRATLAYVATLKADQAARNRTPLGRC